MIDENKLIEEIKERIEKHEKDYQAFKNYSGDRKTKDIAKWDECTAIIELIEKQPKVDDARIVHGEWVDTQPDYNNGCNNNAHKCSICGDYYTTEPEDLFFCPRCGAKMDGKEKKDEKNM